MSGSGVRRAKAALSSGANPWWKPAPPLVAHRHRGEATSTASAETGTSAKFGLLLAIHRRRGLLCMSKKGDCLAKTSYAETFLLNIKSRNWMKLAGFATFLNRMAPHEPSTAVSS
jgi:hypothetical protein